MSANTVNVAAPLPWTTRPSTSSRSWIVPDRGQDLISMGLGDPDLATPAHIVAAAKEAIAQGRTGPAPVMGLPELRQAIARKLARDNGVTVDPETEVLVTTGGQEALFLVIQALIEPGDEVIMPDPRYTSYDEAIDARRGQHRARADDRGRRLRSRPGRSREAADAGEQGPAAGLPQQPDSGHRHPAQHPPAGGDRAGTKPDRHLRRDLREVHLRRPPAPEHRLPAGHARADHHPQRRLQDLRHDRLADRLPGRARPSSCVPSPR